MKKSVKRFIVVVLAGICLFQSSGLALAKVPSDIANSWAKETILSWIEKGLVNGYEDGSFKPNKTITRAEIVALINRAFEIKGGSASKFTDVRKSDWFYQDVAAATAAGYLSGYQDGTFKPKAAVTRQELAVITAKLLKLAASDSYLNFKDTKNSPEWSKGAIGAVIDAKVMGGFPDGTFQPLKPATRAEVIVILDKALKLKGNDVPVTAYDKPGTYGPAQGIEAIDGNVVIKVAGVTLRNLSIKGDLLLGAGIGEGDVFLQGVTVAGTTNVEGGGANSVHFENSVLANIIVDKKNGSIRIVVEDGATTIREIELRSAAKVEYKGAKGSGIKTVTLSKLLPVGSEVVLTGAFETVDILSQSIRISIPEGSVQQLHVAPLAANTNLTLGKDASIVDLVLDALTKVAGQGKIGHAAINADGTSLENKPATLKIKDGITATVGGEQIGSAQASGPAGPAGPTGPVTTPPTAEEVAATTAVVSAETSANGLVGDGTDTQEAIAAAQSKQAAASVLVTALPSSTAKTALATRLAVVQAKIDDAQSDLDAVIAAAASVTAAETAARGLAGDGIDEQEAIDAAQSKQAAASVLVTALPSSTAKTGLAARLTAVQTIINDAQSDLTAVTAATASVTAAETAANGLLGDGSDVQSAIDAAQAKRDTASGLAAALPGSTAKTELENRLAAVQDVINDAQEAVDAVFTAAQSVAAAETAADELTGDGTDAQTAIDAVQTKQDTATGLVAALPDSTAKTALEARLTAVQSSIDNAQNVGDAVTAAAASVTAAETTAGGLADDGTDEQEAIDAAQSDQAAASDLVTDLPSSTAKTALAARITAVQATINVAQSNLDAVTAATAATAAAETAANGLLGDGSDTQGAVDTVQSKQSTASGLVTALPSSTVKTALAARIAAVQATINDAQDVVNTVAAATASVVAAETAADGLAGNGTDTQSGIDAVQTKQSAASGLVTALQDSTAKTALADRLLAVQSAIDSAQDVLDAVVAATASAAAAEAAAGGLAGDGTDVQSVINTVQTKQSTASDLVDALPDSTAKTALAARLAAVQAAIYVAQSNLEDVIEATASVVTAETAANGLAGDGTDAQDAIDTVQTKQSAASDLVTALPSSTAKTALAARVAAVQTKINGAKTGLNAVVAATASVVIAEGESADLIGDGTDTQDTIDMVQAKNDAAALLVTALPGSTAKTALAARLSAVQTKINNAQSSLDAVIAATASVVAAETAANGLLGDGSDTQGAVDAAQAKHNTASGLAAALPGSTAKTALQTRLSTVQTTIDDAQDAVDLVAAATASVVTAETAANGLAGNGTDTQGAIDAAQTKKDTASGLVTDLPSSTAKTALVARLAAVQAAIDAAQSNLNEVIAATASVVTAETTANGLAGDGTDTQGAIIAAQTKQSAASGLVEALPSSTVKTALAGRITAVQAKITGAQSNLDAVIAATASAVAAEAAANGLLGDGSDTQEAVDAVQAKQNAASVLAAALPGSTAKTALQARLSTVQATIDNAQYAVDLVTAATVLVVAAETTANGLASDGTDTQGAIDTVQVKRNMALGSVATLPSSTAQTALAARLAVVQGAINGAQTKLNAVIAATASVVAVEAAAAAMIGDGTDAQEDIDSVQSDQDTASVLVTALPSSTVKTALVNRLAASQVLIDNAQGALDIVVALQEALDAASPLVEVKYTASSWSTLQTALALPQTTLGEKATKVVALNDALNNLVVRIVTSIDVNIISGRDQYILPGFTGPGSHITMQAVVKDQFGVEMKTEGITWSHDSIGVNDRLTDANFGNRYNIYDFNVYNDLIARVVTITVTSVSTPDVKGICVINIIRGR
ncbi:S-layer homology domain-containing protein [Paenibacillus sp. NPDC058174]|uniref:S-layer homology domain-containing protein n=1 Tax=Paenibacillus sp. NPDC058174 TaxID=3346366 RepID=UPI0036DAEDE7